MTDFFVGYGTREGRVYELDTYGLPKPTSTSPYTGIKIKGLSGFNTTQTQVRRIQHYDGDRVSLTQIFPTLDVPGGTITVDGADLSLIAKLSNVKETTLDGVKLIPILSDQQGNEPSVGLIITQAAKNDDGADGYHVLFVNSSQAVPQQGSFGNNNYETTFQMSPSSTTHHLWGADYTTADDGVEASGGDQGFATKKVVITSWLADGTEDEFPFASGLNALDTSYKVYKSTAGVVTEVTSGITKATDKLTFAAAPTSGISIFVMHPIA